METNPFQAPESFGNEQQYDTYHQSEYQVLAARGHRLAAAILDGVVMLVILVPIFIAAAFAFNINFENFDPMLFSHPSFVYGYPVLGMMLWIGVNAKFLIANGQTIGKKIMGIRTVRYDGAKASFGRLTGIRYVIPQCISMIPLVGAFFSFINVLFIFGPEKRCVHDFIADTKVVVA